MVYARYGYPVGCAVCGGGGGIGMFFNGVADFGGVASGDGFENYVVAGEDEVGDCGYVEGI